jgi:hypothetical protein
MYFASKDLMVNVLYSMAEGERKSPCTPSPPEEDCTPSPPQEDCTPSPPDGDCTPSPAERPCTPSPVTGEREARGAGESHLTLGLLRQQLRDELAGA